MFRAALAFNSDISKWKVLRVQNMDGMFFGARLFNSDVSIWKVSNVITMDYMFFHATVFQHKLCRAPWVNSKASKIGMFTGSSGSISQTVSTATFASGAALKSAVV